MGHCAEKGWKMGLLLFTHLVLGAELVIEELGYDGGFADPGAAHDEHPVLGLVPPGPRPRAPRLAAPAVHAAHCARPPSEDGSEETKLGHSITLLIEVRRRPSVPDHPRIGP